MKKCLAAAVAALLLVACNGEPDPRTLPPRVDRLQGRVVEQIDSAPYSFFRIETADGPRWVALPIGTAPRNGVLSVTQAALVKNRRLPAAGRTLAAVYFARPETN